MIDDDKDYDFIANLSYDWNSAIESFQEELCDVQTETLSNQQMSNIIIQLKHSDGSEFWENNRYPEFNDPILSKKS